MACAGICSTRPLKKSSIHPCIQFRELSLNMITSIKRGINPINDGPSFRGMANPRTQASITINIMRTGNAMSVGVEETVIERKLLF